MVRGSGHRLQKELVLDVRKEESGLRYDGLRVAQENITAEPLGAQLAPMKFTRRQADVAQAANHASRRSELRMLKMNQWSYSPGQRSPGTESPRKTLPLRLNHKEALWPRAKSRQVATQQQGFPVIPAVLPALSREAP
ncbi:hypothetical protein CB1_000709010 [Camelus ferus]|nr:hypothetical protein CB1_000709010 [Camelus ferus]